MLDGKKKKRGLMSLEEKMGLDEGSEYTVPSSKTILPTTAEEGLNERDRQRSIGSRVRDRMTGRA